MRGGRSWGVSAGGVRTGPSRWRAIGAGVPDARSLFGDRLTRTASPLSLLLALTLAACTGDTPKEAGVDADADGYFDLASGGDDCDDADAAVHPDALEVCGGVDEDCDGDVDDADDSVDPAALFRWYPDGDGDGYGDPGGATSACEPDEGFIAEAGDCDDTRAEISPDATEVCDESGVDEDCDGAANDGDPGVTGTTVWYADTDGDDFGDTASPREACDLPEGFAAVGEDCDDTNATAFPGGAEVCDALNADEDCNGAADDADAGASGAVTWYVDADADGWGGEAVGVRCDALAGETANAGDCNDAAAAVNGDDGDGDGASSCDGDCADDDAAVTVTDCVYTSMVGTFDLGTVCSFDLAGTALAAPVACPSCEFAFDTTGTPSSGICDSTFYAELGWDADGETLSFALYGAYELGPFAGTLTTGAGYDTLEWAGYGMSPDYLYEGTMLLYR